MKNKTTTLKAVESPSKCWRAVDIYSQEEYVKVNGIIVKKSERDNSLILNEEEYKYV